jgi:hypothetical protein
MKVQSTYGKGFMKLKVTLMLCRQRTLHQIVLVLRGSAHAMVDAKSASNITKKKANGPTVQDNRLKNHVFFSFALSYISLSNLSPKGVECSAKTFLGFLP